MRLIVKAAPGLEGYANQLAAFPVKARRAMVEGTNEGGDLERTEVRRDLKEQTGVVRYGSVTKRTRSKRATAGDIAYSIIGEGKGLPIKEFPVTASTRSPVSARPWRVLHKFARSFKTSGQGLLRARIGASRMPIRALYGPSIAKEIVKDQTRAGFEATAAPKVERAVMKRLVRLLP